MSKKYKHNFLQKGLKFVSKNMKQKAWDFVLLSSLCLLILGSIFMLPLKAVVFVFLVLINGVIYAFYRSQKKTKKKKQEQKIYFRDIEFLSPQAKQKILDGSLICAFLVLIITSIFMLHWESVFIIFLLILNIFLYASYRYSISVPFASRISKKYVKKNFLEFSRINEPYFKTRLLYYLTLLVHDIDTGFELLFEKTDAYFLEKIFSKNGKDIPASKHTEKTLEESMDYLRAKKKEVTMISMASSAGVTVCVLILTLILSSQTRAATYQWVQSSWAGGADTSAIAGHPSNLTGWTKYFSKDSLLSAGSDGVIANATSTMFITTTNSDFASNTTTNATSTSNSLYLLKPIGATCSISSECGNNDCSSSVCFACGTSSIRDYEGNSYGTVQVGAQCWMASNLRTKYKQNGTCINGYSTPCPNASASDAGKGRLCYNHNESNCTAQGALYLLSAVLNGTTTIGARGICPLGWHIPTRTEFQVLVGYLGTSTAGTQMKVGGSSGLNVPLTGYYESATGNFYNQNASAYLAEYHEVNKEGRIHLASNWATVYFESSDQDSLAMSLRCIKD